MMMKTKHISTTIVLAVLFLTSCGNSEKKEKTHSEAVPVSKQEAKTESVKASENDIDLKQNGDYTQLYVESEDCKLTTAQLAEALGYNDNQVVEQSNYQGSCWYKVTHPGNFTVNYGISLEKWGDKAIVEDQIKSGLKNDLINVQVSESGDTYLKRHPVQGFLLLLNSNYGNPIKISNSYLNTNGHKLTEAQKEERRENAYKIANYLINAYKN